MDSFEPVKVEDGTYVMSGDLPLSGDEQAPSIIEVQLTDDSPEDGSGGAALFGHDLRIRSKDFETGQETVHTLSEVVRPGGNWPAIFGGFAGRGFLHADGEERIVLKYDFTDSAYTGPDQSLLIRIEFELEVALDYRIEVKSDT